MTPSDLLRRLVAAGHACTPDHSAPGVASPGSLYITPPLQPGELRSLVVANKLALLAYLRDLARMSEAGERFGEALLAKGTTPLSNAEMQGIAAEELGAPMPTCPVCGALQQRTLAGWVCRNGHIEKAEKPTVEVMNTATGPVTLVTEPFAFGRNAPLDPDGEADELLHGLRVQGMTVEIDRGDRTKLRIVPPVDGVIRPLVIRLKPALLALLEKEGMVHERDSAPTPFRGSRVGGSAVDQGGVPVAGDGVDGGQTGTVAEPRGGDAGEERGGGDGAAGAGEASGQPGDTQREGGDKPAPVAAWAGWTRSLTRPPKRKLPWTRLCESADWGDCLDLLRVLIRELGEHAVELVVLQADKQP